MIYRELGLVEIENRIKAAAATLGIVTWKRSPLVPLDGEKMPFVFMIEGPDPITDYNSRGKGGYPARRQLEVTIEMIAEEGFDIKQLYRDLRAVVFSNYTVAENTTIYELRAEGPFGYGVPKLHGMRFVLALNYSDKGN